MKQFLFLLVCLTTLTCCNNDDDESLLTCECECTDLSWLQEIKKTLTNCDQYTTKSIYQAVYKEQTVFFKQITNNNPASSSVWKITLWDCEGVDIRTFQYDEQEEFYKIVTDMVVLYSCKK